LGLGVAVVRLQLLLLLGRGLLLVQAAADDDALHIDVCLAGLLYQQVPFVAC
jgi:hypothetical protein